MHHKILENHIYFLEMVLCEKYFKNKNEQTLYET